MRRQKSRSSHVLPRLQNNHDYVEHIHNVNQKVRPSSYRNLALKMQVLSLPECFHKEGHEPLNINAIVLSQVTRVIIGVIFWLLHLHNV